MILHMLKFEKHIKETLDPHGHIDEGAIWGSDSLVGPSETFSKVFRGRALSHCSSISELQKARGRMTS